MVSRQSNCTRIFELLNARVVTRDGCVPIAEQMAVETEDGGRLPRVPGRGLTRQVAGNIQDTVAFEVPIAIKNVGGQRRFTPDILAAGYEDAVSQVFRDEGKKTSLGADPVPLRGVETALMVVLVIQEEISRTPGVTQ